ncbi:hypothetical protein KSP40_PGU017079 [Platanthera guangdongensis]|uniref:Uncharacterized protein n=1 Tax=Platanthera guangdongensis TaxID=2320717 RepID=A0ABR2MIN1_9ASPA
MRFKAIAAILRDSNSNRKCKDTGQGFHCCTMAGDSPPAMSSGGISRFLLGFLQEHLGEPEDLASLPSLTARLKCECDDREEELLHLKTKLSLALSSWISQSAEAGVIFSRIESGPPLPSQGPPAIKPNLSLNDMSV